MQLFYCFCIAQPQDLPNLKENAEKLPEVKIDLPNLNNIENKESEKEIRHEPPQPVEPVDAASNPKKEPVDDTKIKDKDPVQNEIPKEEKKEQPETGENKEKQGPVVEPIFPNEKLEENKEKQEQVVESVLLDGKVDLNKEKQELVVEPVFPNEKPEQDKEKPGPILEPVLPENNNAQNEKIPEVPVVPPGKENSPNMKNQNQPKVEIDGKKPKDLIENSEQKKPDEVDAEAIKKEETELKEQENEKQKADDVGKLHLIDTLEKQNEVQQQLVEQQKKLIEVIKQLETEKQHNDIEKEKMEAVKQIESIAKKAIESLSGKDAENAATGSNDAVGKIDVVSQKTEEAVDAKDGVVVVKSQKVQEQKTEDKNSLNMVPIPIAKSKNLTIYGQPRNIPIIEGAKKDDTIPKIHKENEININQVDNMNINIKHEINLNVDSKDNPKTLMDLLKGGSINNTNTKDKEDANKLKEEKKDENIQAVRRDILSNDLKLSREKRNSQIDGEKSKQTFGFKISPDSPLMQMVTKLSESELSGIGNVHFKEINGILRPIVNDLKDIKVSVS